MVPQAYPRQTQHLRAVTEEAGHRGGLEGRRVRPHYAECEAEASFISKRAESSCRRSPRHPWAGAASKTAGPAASLRVHEARRSSMFVPFGRAPVPSDTHLRVEQAFLPQEGERILIGSRIWSFGSGLEWRSVCRWAPVCAGRGGTRRTGSGASVGAARSSTRGAGPCAGSTAGIGARLGCDTGGALRPSPPLGVPMCAADGDQASWRTLRPMGSTYMPSQLAEVPATASKRKVNLQVWSSMAPICMRTRR